LKRYHLNLKVGGRENSFLFLFEGKKKKAWERREIASHPKGGKDLPILKKERRDEIFKNGLFYLPQKGEEAINILRGGEE